MFSEKRAITPVIATLLLIAITVAAVAGFYIFYTNFVGQSDISAQEPAASIYGPSMAAEGDTVTLSVKNSGNVEFTNLTATTSPSLTFSPSNWLSQISDSNPLKVGGSVACSTTLAAPGSNDAWTITITAKTKGGTSVVDVWVIKEQ